ncbi:hypothetical protein K1719_042407 [Acacia pycnantha]|nr:hypothetical protein K1719_042407 [Acacia pycnantha]
MEDCTLCGKRARMYCESDQAKLCWDCDDKVHGANFLVAKHTRVLLCRNCQSFTPWKACGPKLTPTHSLCSHCASNSNKHQQEEDDRDHRHHDLRDISDRDDEDYDDGDSSSDSDSGYEDDDEEDEGENEEEEEGENQVVPWSCASASVSSPPVASSASAGSGLAWKRRRTSSFVDSDDEIGCSSSEMPSATQLPDDDSSSLSNLRPWKHPRTTQQSQ